MNPLEVIKREPDFICQGSHRFLKVWHNKGGNLFYYKYDGYSRNDYSNMKIEGDNRIYYKHMYGSWYEWNNCDTEITYEQVLSEYTAWKNKLDNILLEEE